MKVFRKVNKLHILATSKVLYSTRRGNIIIYLKYKNKDFVKISLTNILYTPVNIILLSIIRLIKKYIKVYLGVILKPIILVKYGDIFEYIVIKNNLYYLRILDEHANSKEK